NADHHELLGVLLLQLGQIGQRMDAVDAAERPKIEYDDLALEILNANWSGGVQPGDAAFQLRSAETLVLWLRGHQMRRRKGNKGEDRADYDDDACTRRDHAGFPNNRGRG